MQSSTTAAAAAIAGFLAHAVPASAGDYYNACTTNDPRFEIQDDILVAKSDPRQEPIDFQILDKTTTSERRGYCESRGKRFNFESRNATMRIRFNYRGSTIETLATCEFAASGLPAAYDCEREVVTYTHSGERRDEPGRSRGATLWNHNGSIMRLEAEGNIRRFVYEEPRPGMVRHGARPGDVVFQGRRNRMIYSGTAYIFSKRCGRVAYPVSGRVRADQRAVVMTGRAPRLDRNCNVKSYRRDRLSFELIGR